MATITRIRQNSGLVLIVIGLGMGAFILGDFFRGGGQRQTQYVGEIAGEKIESIQYQRALDLQIEALRSVNQNPDAESTDQIRNQVWNDILREKTVGQEVRKAGFTVTQDEYDDLRWGDNVIPSFKNDRTFSPEGTFNPDAVKQYFKFIIETYPLYAQVQQKQIIENRETTKYYNAIAGGLKANSLEALKIARSNDSKISFEFVYKRLTTVPDSLVEISDLDLKAYYQAHKGEEKYEQNESRSARFVTFDVKATADDKKFIRQEIALLIPEFEKAENDSIFVLANAETKTGYNQIYSPGSLADAAADSLLSNAESGQVVGPYEENNAFKIAKITGENFEEQARVRHILLRTDGTNDQKIKIRADSLKRVIQSQRNFTEMVTQFSDDAASIKDGGVYDWFPQGRMVPEFNDASFNNRIGSISVVKTTYGYHIIEVLGQRELRQPKISVIDRAIVPSPDTFDEIYRTATDFSINYASAELFDQGADTLGLTAKTANKIKKGARSVAGLSNASDFSRWMYKANLNEISSPIEIDDQFIVALLTGIAEKGEPAFDDIKDQFKNQLLTERKKEFIISEMEGNTDLADLAKSLNLSVQTASNIPLSSNTIPGGGSGEEKVIGAAFTMEIGDVSVPMEGSSGVYVIEITDKKMPSDEALDAELFRDDIDQKYDSRVSNGVFSALRDDAEVEDNRSDFY